MNEPVHQEEWRECGNCGRRWLGGYDHCCHCAQGQIDHWKQKAIAAEQLAMRQANQIRKLQREQA